MLDFTFPEIDQIFGNKQSDIFKAYGTKCAISDFAILLGGFVANGIYTTEGNTLKDRTGYWWTRTSDGDNDARVVRKNGNRN